MKTNASLTITIIPRGKGKFIAYLDDEPLCQRTFSPFVAAARTLLAKGYHPNTVLVGRHIGSEIEALKSTIALAAKLSVKETSLHRPRFVPFRGFPAKLRHRAGLMAPKPNKRKLPRKRPKVA